MKSGNAGVLFDLGTQLLDAAPLQVGTVGGPTPIAFTALPSSLAAIQSGQVRAIGVAAAERAEGIPDVSTFAEQGINGQDADTLTGIVAPAGTPKQIVELISREIARSVARPARASGRAALQVVLRRFKPVATDPRCSRFLLSLGHWVERRGWRIKGEIEKWGKVVRDANLRID